MRRHDRYVARSFWTTFIAIILFFTVIVIVLDAAERARKLTRFWDQISARGQHPVGVMAEYYLTLIPFMWLRLMPFCVSAAAAFCLARLIRHNELTPLVTGGVPMRRTVRPIVASGLLLVVGMLVLQETLLPTLNRRHLELWRILTRNTPDRVTNVAHFHDRRGGRLSMEAYLPFRKRMEAVMITFYDKTSGDPVQQFWYPELAWEEERKVWIATRAGLQVPLDDPQYPGMHRIELEAGSMAPLEAWADLIEIALTAKMSPGLSYRQVEALSEENPDNPHFTVLKHEMITLPLSTLVLLLLALPFSLRIARRTKSAIPGMLGALAVAGLFFGLQFVTASLARAGDWNPAVLAWLPTVLFGSLGIVLYLTLDG